MSPRWRVLPPGQETAAYTSAQGSPHGRDEATVAAVAAEGMRRSFLIRVHASLPGIPRQRWMSGRPLGKLRGWSMPTYGSSAFLLMPVHLSPHCLRSPDRLSVLKLM